ncbi:MAG: cupin domain-containing protein [Nanoarchaeota archaeon]
MKKKGLDEPLYKDSRGEIHRINIKGVRFNALFTKKGALRSGDYHPNTQYNIILKGILEITIRKNGKDITSRNEPGQLIIIPPNTPHLYKSVTDTVLLEWWSGPFKVKYYMPYRKIIEKQLKNTKPKRSKAQK